MQRIFISVEISENVKRFVHEHIKGLKKIQSGMRVSWVRPDKLHLTLRFLGEIEEALISRVRESVDEVAKKTPSFRLTLTKTGVFPNKKRPRVFWLGMQDYAGILPGLKKDLDERLEKIGFESEDRIFQPHLTIARLRQAKGARDLVENHLETVFEPIEFGVTEIAVMESRLENTGSVYTKLSGAKFK